MKFFSPARRVCKESKIQFCGPTGGDAIEAAIKLVKTATGNRSILSFHGAYHGATHGTMSLSGNLSPKERVQGLIPDVHFMPYPYEYRCPFGIGGKDSHRISSSYIERVLNDPESGILPPAGMIFEAVQGEGGSIPASIEWIKEMRRITKKKAFRSLSMRFNQALAEQVRCLPLNMQELCQTLLYYLKPLVEACRFQL